MLPWLTRYAWPLAAVAWLATAGVAVHRHAAALRLEVALADEKAERQREARVLAQSALKRQNELAAQRVAAEKKWMESLDEAHRFRQAAETAAAGAADAGRRLRAEQARLLATCRGAAAPTAAASASTAAEASVDLLADMQRRLDEAADGIARFADESRAAGLACEGQYLALTLTGVRRKASSKWAGGVSRLEPAATHLGGDIRR